MQTRRGEAKPQELAIGRPSTVAATAELSPAACDLVRDDPAPSDFLRALLQGGHHRDALQYLAHALPRRAAVRWACACVAEAQDGALSPGAEDALRAALQWADAPGAGNCAHAATAASGVPEAAEAARFAALAAAWSGDSLAAEGLPAVPPPARIGAAAAAAAVQLACAARGHLARAAVERGFIARGILLARSAP